MVNMSCHVAASTLPGNGASVIELAALGELTRVLARGLRTGDVTANAVSTDVSRPESDRRGVAHLLSRTRHVIRGRVIRLDHDGRARPWRDQWRDQWRGQCLRGRASRHRTTILNSSTPAQEPERTEQS